jgi:sporulation protein YlmC with PRC-barrel domain
MKNRRLQELDHSNFEIVKGEPDIRGWDVRYRDGEKIGSVEELILDTKEKKVRYMVVDLDENELRLERRKILIPIGMAELDHMEDDVLMPNISVDQICDLPVYERNNLTPDSERRIASTLGRKVRSTLAASKETARANAKATEKKLKKEEKTIKRNVSDEIDPDFYDHEHYNLDNLYKNRLHEAHRKNNESEFDRSLRLWERRSEGGIIDEPTVNLSEEERIKRVRNRRNIYRERRYNNESV